MRYLDVAARVLLVTVFAVALAGKVSSGAAFGAFTESLRRMDAVPAARVELAARATVMVEALVVVLLVVPAAAAAAVGFALAAGLLLVFALAIARAVAGGRQVPCRCFGASSTPLGRGHVVRDVLLAVAALAGLAAALQPGDAVLAGALVAAVAGLVLGALFTSYDTLAAVVRGV